MNREGLAHSPHHQQHRSKDRASQGEDGAASQAGEIYLNEGVESKKISERIMEETGMSYRWVMKYLPDKYKAEPEKGKGSKPLNLTNVKVARRATEEEELLRAPPEKQILTVKKYANTHFVNVIVEKLFYTKLEKAAEKLGTTPDMLINNALLLILKRLEEKVRSG